jgi:hypothetical protein
LRKQASEFEATTMFLFKIMKQDFEFSNNSASALANYKPIITKAWKLFTEKH